MMRLMGSQGKEQEEEEWPTYRFDVVLAECGPVVSMKTLLRKQAALEEQADLPEEQGGSFLERLEKKVRARQAEEMLESSEERSEEDEEESVASKQSYYDTEDSFIDDSDVFDVKAAEEIETEVKGFFVAGNNIAVKQKVAKPKKKKSTKKEAARSQEEVPDSSEAEEADVAVEGFGLRYPTAIATSLEKLREEARKLPPAESSGNKPKALPSAIETLLCEVEHGLRKVYSVVKRGPIYEDLAKSLPRLNRTSATLKARIKRCYIHWLPGKLEDDVRKAMTRLKAKIKYDCRNYASNVEKQLFDKPNVTVKGGVPKYRCRWDNFADGLMKLDDVLSSFVAATNISRKKNVKNNEAVVLLKLDDVRKNHFKKLVACWPPDFNVQLSNMNQAFGRYMKKKGESGSEKDDDASKNSKPTQPALDRVPEQSNEPSSASVSAVPETTAAVPPASPKPMETSKRPIEPSPNTAQDPPAKKRKKGPTCTNLFESLPEDPWADKHFVSDTPQASLTNIPELHQQ